MLIDTHCHVQFNAYKEDGDSVLKRCREKNMILNVVGSQIDTSRRAVRLAEQHDDVYASIGLHPVHLFTAQVDEGEVSFQTREEKFDYHAYRELALHPKTIAIGECGLELYHLPEHLKREEVLIRQEQTFMEQCRLAEECGLPLVVHVREAHTQMISLFHRLPTVPRGVIHCYTGNWTDAQEYLRLGFYLGFTGVVTFPPKKNDPRPQLDLMEVIQKCPLDRMLIETDAPYLAPQAYRGERCEPWMVEEVGKKIAELKNILLAPAMQLFEDNARALFTKIK